MQSNDLLDRLIASTGAKHDSDLAKRIGITHAAITHYRIGRRKPGVLFLHRVCKAFPELRAIVSEYVETYQDDS